MGVIASHDEYPIERLSLDRRRKWLGSVSHDECIKLTDVEDLFEDSEGEDEGQDTAMEDGSADADVSEADDAAMDGVEDSVHEAEEAHGAEDESSDEEVAVRATKRGKGGMGDLGRETKARKANGDCNFFADL